MSPESDYFVPGLWLKDTFNLIAGASGAGKTRWILPQLIELQKRGLEVLYTCCDRSAKDGRRTLVNMGYPPDVLPIASFQDEHEDTKFDISGLEALAIAHRITKRKKIDILFVESITILAGDPNKSVDVCNFSRRLNRLMEKERLSVWGTSWVSKVKENAKFVNTRDNVMGSAAWPGICGTMAVILSPNGEEAPERDVKIMLRDGSPRTEHYRFNDRGILELYEPPSFDSLLDGGGTIFRTDAIEMAERLAFKSPEKAANRWIASMLEAKKLLRVRAGEYLVM